MRRIMAIVAVAIVTTGFMATAAQAQFPLTFVGGVTLANVSSEDFETSSTTGFFAGLGTSFPLSETVGLSPFVAYVQKGAKFEDDSKGTYTYIEIPVFLDVNIPVGESMTLNLGAGPAVGFQISCDEDDFDCTEYENHKSTEFSVIGSGGLVFPMGGGTSAFSVGAGYDYGMTDLFDELDYKTRTMYLYVTFTKVLGG